MTTISTLLATVAYFSANKFYNDYFNNQYKTKTNINTHRQLQEEPCPEYSEFQVNTHNTLNQFESSISKLTDGKFVITWVSENQDGSSWGIFAQMYNIDGSTFGSEFQVNTHTDNHQDRPEISGFNNGKFVITWMSYTQDGSHYGIFAQMYNNDGTKFGSEFQVNTYTNGVQSVVRISTLSNNKFVITWQSHLQDGNGYGIFAQMYNENGSKIGSEFQVNTYTNNDQEYASVSGLTDGKFVITWISHTQDGSSWGIFAQMYNNDGTKFGSEFQVNTYTNSAQSYTGVSKLTNKFIIIWNSDGQDGDSYGIFAQMYNNDGTKFGSEFQVNTYTNSEQEFASISELSNSKFIITWRSNTQDGDSYGIFAQIYNNDGSKFKSEFQVNTYTNGIQSRPKPIGLPDGKIVITWHSNNQDGDGYGVFAKIFNNVDNCPLIPTLTPTANPTVAPTLNPTANPTTAPTLTPTANPTVAPTLNPTVNPTTAPTLNPTVNPTTAPTLNPTVNPTTAPTLTPTVNPTTAPTLTPTINPTVNPDDYTCGGIDNKPCKNDHLVCVDNPFDNCNPKQGDLHCDGFCVIPILDYIPDTLDNDKTCSFGIKNDKGNICCPAECGSCGGPGCGSRSGGGSKCCTSVIKESGISCSNSLAPCIIY